MNNDNSASSARNRARALARAERLDPFGENDYAPDDIVTYEYVVSTRIGIPAEEAEVVAMARIRAERLDPDKFAATPFAAAGYTLSNLTTFIEMACWLAETPDGIPGFNPVRTGGPYTDPDGHPVHLFSAELGIPGEDVLTDWVWCAGVLHETWPSLLGLLGFRVRGKALNFDGDTLAVLDVPGRSTGQ